MAIGTPERKKVNDWFCRTIRIDVVKTPDFVPNELITKTLWSIVLQYSKEAQSIDAKIQQGKEVNDRIQKVLLIDLAPGPIGDALRRIFATPDLSKERADHIAQYQHTLLQSCLLITLSDLVQNVGQDFSSLKIDPKDIKELLFSAGSGGTFDTLRRILQIVAPLKFSPFIGELFGLEEKLSQSKPGDAYSFFEDYRKGEFDSDDEVRLCKDAEEQLCKLLPDLAFLHSYHWKSIRNIEAKISKSKGGTDTYTINYFDLNRITTDLTLENKELPKVIPDNCVLLFRPTDHSIDSEHLQLFPFIIDDYEKSRDFPRIYFFSHKSKQGYVFNHINHSETKVFNTYSKQVSEIATALSGLEKLILG